MKKNTHAPNKSKKKGIALYWILAIVVTLGAAVFQRMTGPTHPQRISFELGGVTYKTRLARSLEIPLDANGGAQPRTNLNISIDNLPADAMLRVYAKRYRTDDPFTLVTTTQREGGKVSATLPTQPQAGKLAYYVQVERGGEVVELQKTDPVVLRFKGSVPAAILVPHILLMFVAMLLSTLAGLLAIAKHDKFLTYAKLATVCLAIGGLILGPLVQKYAFGGLWAGFPIGSDLTDNKTLIAFLIWVVALAMGRRNTRFTWAAIASLMLLLVYSIPHSSQGSEFDHATGEIRTGQIE